MRADAKPHAPADDIDMRALLRALRRALPKVALAGLGLGALTYLTLLLVAPRFTSEAELAILAKSLNPFPDEKAQGFEAISSKLDKEAVNTHARALVAPDLLLSVASEFGLRDNPEFNEARGHIDTLSALLAITGLGGARSGESDEDRVLSSVTRALEVSAIKDSRFIAVRFTSADNDLSAKFANRLAESYRERLVKAPVQETKTAVAALAPQVEQLRKEVFQADAEVETYRATTDQLKTGGAMSSIDDQRLANLSDQLTKADAKRTEAEGRARTARALIATQAGDALPDVQRSPVMQNLIAQRVRLERQIAEASATLLSGHPRMRELNADLAGLKRQIKDEILKIVQGIEKDASAASNEARGLEAQIRAQRSKVVSASGNEARLKALEAKAKAKRAELDQLERQVEANRTTLAVNRVPIEAEIVSRARATSVPTSPKRGPWSALVAAATMLLGLVFALTRELVMGASPSKAPSKAWSTPAAPPKTTEPVAAPGSHDVALKPGASLGPEIASFVPIARSAAPASEKSPLAPNLIATKAAHDLAFDLRREANGRHGFRLLLTGAATPRARADAAIDLADALATSSAAVLLLDWAPSGLELNHQGLSQVLGIAGHAGLAEVLAGTGELAQVVHRLDGARVDVIAGWAAGASMPAPSDKARLNQILDSFDETYSYIVVVASEADGKALFEALDGRFDAGVVVTGASERVSPGQFLGFEVTGMGLHSLGHSQDAPKPGSHDRLELAEPLGV